MLKYEELVEGDFTSTRGRCGTSCRRGRGGTSGSRGREEYDEDESIVKQVFGEVLSYEVVDVNSNEGKVGGN